MISVICSGGQAGADRGGLDAAIAVGLLHRGWCPKGRRAEDGVISPQYLLQECWSSDYLVRTELNVIDSDATILFTRDGSVLTPGTRKTAELCARHGKGVVKFGLDLSDEVITNFILALSYRVVNIAGSRESKVPGIQERVKGIMIAVLRRQADDFLDRQ